MRQGTCRVRRLRAALVVVAALPACAPALHAQCDPGSLFSPPAGYATGSLPRCLVSGDFNGDAVADIAVANGATGANTISILLGNGAPGPGDGTFRPAGTVSAGGPALGLEAGDFNGDGIRDLAVANGGAGTVSVLLGQGAGGVGDGTFGSPASYGVGSAPEHLAAGDFNGDAIQDLAVVDRSTRGVYALLGQGAAGVGDGTFAAGYNAILVHTPFAIVTADLDADGILDLAFIATGRFGVMLGTGAGGVGDGSFAPPVYYLAGLSPSDFAVSDFNADGRPDVAVANRVRGGIRVLYGLGGGAFGGARDFAVGLTLSSVAVSYADGDPIPDLLTTASPGDQLLFLRGGGANGVASGIFGNPTVEGVLGVAPSDLLVADFNGDCVDDVAAVNSGGTPDPPTNLSILIARCLPATCTKSPGSFLAADRPDDQGGYVRLNWSRSALDSPNGGAVSTYQIWSRVIENGSALARPAPPRGAPHPGPGRATQPTPGEWVRILDVPAVGAKLYQADAPTTRDSVSGDDALHEFFVRAVTTSLDVHDSGTLVLSSVDNLAPPPPAHVLAQPTPTGSIWLHWAASDAPDLLEYRVHRGGSPIFLPGPDNLIAVVADTQHIDPAGPATSTYKVVPVDVHGNTGPAGGGAAVLCAPPACGFTARYPVVIRSLEATAFDTTFTNAFSEEFRAAYDLAVGWLRAETFGQPGIDIATTTQDVYWIEGAPIDQALTFHASLQVGAITTQNCGHHCAAGYVSASIAEVGVPSSPCPGSSQPCVVVTRRGYEPFRLGVSLVAGIGGSVFSASAKGLASLRISGLPPGAYVTSCSGYISDTTVPVQLSLAYARVEEGVARLAWYTPDRSVPLATVHRRSDDEGWTRLGEILADGSGYLVYEDRAIVAGIRYGYRLGVTEGGEERLLGETWLEIPSSVRLTLDQVAPNPATGPLRARFSLPSARPARLEVFDLGGRRVHVREVGALGRGDHTLVLEETGPLRPGIYLVRLAQDDARISRRVVKIR